MKKISDIMPKGLAGKLIRLVVIVVLCMGFAFLIVSHVQLNMLNKTVEQEGQRQSDLVNEMTLHPGDR